MPRRIWILLAAHVVLDVVLIASIWLVHPNIYVYGCRAFITAQLCLLIIWGGAGNARWWWRLAVALLGIVCVLLLMGVAEVIWLVKLSATFVELPTYSLHGSPTVEVQISTSWNVFAAMIASDLPETAITVTSLGFAMLLMRLRKFRLYYFRQQERLPKTTGFQFTIRQILLLTAVVAVVMGTGQQMRSRYANVSFKEMGTAYFVMSNLVESAWDVTIALLAVWASLNLQSPRWRVIATLGISGGIGLIMPLCFVGWSTFTAISTCIEAMVLIASLLVVRSCGYRLVRQSPGEEPLPEVATT